MNEFGRLLRLYRRQCTDEERKGRPLTQADTLLQAGNYRPLYEEERLQVFPAPSQYQPPEPGNQWRFVATLLTDLLFRPGEALGELASNAGTGPPP